MQNSFPDPNVAHIEDITIYIERVDTDANNEIVFEQEFDLPEDRVIDLVRATEELVKKSLEQGDSS